MRWDFFICHAREDKDSVARPLSQMLQKAGFHVWYDETQLTLGDSLRRTIDEGLAGSRFGLVILSHAFFSKEWPKKELDSLVALEDSGKKRILPIWHQLTQEDVAHYSPILADRLAVTTALGLKHVVSEVCQAIPAVPLPPIRNATVPENLPLSILYLLYEFYETKKFVSRKSRSDNPELDRERDEKRLAEAGLIWFTVYGEGGAWGYELTGLGCDILKKAYNLNEIPKDFWRWNE